MKKGKSVLQSKVFWFNFLTAVVAVASMFGFNEFEPNPRLLEIIGAVSAIVNIGLRLVTVKPIDKII